ncbi:hypothetical protein SprV_0401467700 [Sparganum proliferum]
MVQHADSNESKNFFAPVKTVSYSITKGSDPLLSSDFTTLLTENSQILKRWDGHFGSVLNRPSTISDVASCRLSQVETSNDMDFPPSPPPGNSESRAPVVWRKGTGSPHDPR